MKVIGILNELYNNNKLENKRFKIPDGTILKNTEDLLKYVGLYDDEWFAFNDIIESLQSEVEILEDEEPDLFEMTDDLYIEEKPKHIEELKLNQSDVWNGKTDTDLILEKINELRKAVNYLLYKDK